MRIELLGPSGAGKTTTLVAAMSNPRRRWLGPDDLADDVPKPTNDDLREAIDNPDLRDFVTWFIAKVATTTMAPSQKVALMRILARSCHDTTTINALPLSRTVIHDELLLHRAFSLLPRIEDTEMAVADYFNLVPLPDAAVVVTADPDTIHRRTTARGPLPNVYRDADPAAVHATITRAVLVAELAAEALTARGIPVLRLDSTTEPDHTAARLNDFISAQEPAMTDESDDIRARLLSASGSFRKKAGRHELRTKDVMYCAFSTPNFTITPEESQRDATKRVAAFGLTREQVEGRTVLDLGSNAGAMLFEISNFHPAAGLGIEYDSDKVDLATEIATLASIPDLRFEAGDIDLLDAATVGVHDIVFALAIEGHVQDPDRLYELLGKVTGDLLCFEGNGKCDMDYVRSRLSLAGFGDFVDLGFCQDDRDPRNNNRPQMLARKVSTKKGLFSKFRARR
jgi:hypothetical protein